MKATVVNLAFLIREDQVLLAMKKRGFGEGRYNGVGGKIEPNESVEESLIRETQEEIDITITNFEKVAEITFDEFFKGQPELVQVHVFTASEWIGEPKESEEMAPKWFNKNEIPFSEMWPDDPYWLPQVLEGKKIVAKFKLDINDQVVSRHVKTVKGFM